MNKYELIGSVSYFETKVFQGKDGKEIKKFTWVLSSKVGNAFNNIPCESWNFSFEALKDGMVIQLTEYIPRNNRYQDKQTLQWKSRFLLDVKEARVVYEDEISGRGLVFDTTKTFETTKKNIQELKTNVSQFNVAQEVAKLESEMSNEIKQEEQLEEVVDLEWFTPEELKQMEQERQELAKENEEKERIANETLEEIANEKANAKKVEIPSVSFPTQEFLDSLNNIPKLNNDSGYNGGVVGEVGGAKIIEDNEDW